MVSGRSAHKKRPLPSSASTSTPSQSQSTSRATKRSRGQYEPLEASRVDPLPAAPLAPAPAAVPLAPIPPKRELHAGTLRRLALPRPNSTTSTLAGAKIGGKSKDLEIPKGGNSDDMYITRKGLGYGGYLKKGVTGFLQRGYVYFASQTGWTRADEDWGQDYKVVDACHGSCYSPGTLARSGD
jgi:hypothetical protein